MPRSVKHGGKKVQRYREHKNASKAKNKALKKKKAMHTKCTQLAQEWDPSKSAMQNLAAVGLAYDANKVVPLKQNLVGKGKAGEEVMEVEEGSVADAKKLGTVSAQLKKKRGKKAEEKKPTRVVASLEAEADAANAANHEAGPKARLLDRDIEYCVYMDAKHGEDFKAMARDAKNIFQDTPKQLERKIRVYKQSPYYKAIEGMETS